MEGKSYTLSTPIDYLNPLGFQLAGYHVVREKDRAEMAPFRVGRLREF